VTILTLAARNLTRNKTRVVLTVLGVGVAVLAFMLIRVVVWAWSMGGEVAAKDRIGTRDKITFVNRLPLRYAQDLKDAAAPLGVTHVTYMDWFGGKDPRNDSLFFGAFAVDHATFLDVYNELSISPEARERWKSDPQAALVGKNLAKKLQVKEGDKITLISPIYPGDWEFHVAAVYRSTAKSFDESSFIFRWDYLNNNKALPASQKDRIGWLAAKLTDPGRSAEISKAIDKAFDDRDQQTLSMSERDLNTSFVGMVAAVLQILNIASFVILLILGLILGNTIAMGVRERTYEHGVLRALGFMPRHITMFVVAEALFIGALGGAFGLALAYAMSRLLRLADGPDEVHRNQIGQLELRKYQ